MTGVAGPLQRAPRRRRAPEAACGMWDPFRGSRPRRAASRRASKPTPSGALANRARLRWRPNSGRPDSALERLSSLRSLTNGTAILPGTNAFGLERSPVHRPARDCPRGRAGGAGADGQVRAIQESPGTSGKAEASPGTPARGGEDLRIRGFGSKGEGGERRPGARAPPSVRSRRPGSRKRRKYFEIFLSADRGFSRGCRQKKIAAGRFGRRPEISATRRENQPRRRPGTPGARAPPSVRSRRPGSRERRKYFEIFLSADRGFSRGCRQKKIAAGRFGRRPEISATRRETPPRRRPGTPGARAPPSVRSRRPGSRERRKYFEIFLSADRGFSRGCRQKKIAAGRFGRRPEISATRRETPPRRRPGTPGARAPPSVRSRRPGSRERRKYFEIFLSADRGFSRGCRQKKIAAGRCARRFGRRPEISATQRETPPRRRRGRAASPPAGTGGQTPPRPRATPRLRNRSHRGEVGPGLRTGLIFLRFNRLETGLRGFSLARRPS